ncbi:MAG: YkgJ family cysteine cluster protein [Proteobacteria bacterium]|nr:YkgJ family cysteine cluster protein [Pseudomonadota bacterium]
MSDAEGRACVMAVVTDERGPPLPDDCPGCALWEPRIDSCDLCGACCREAFDSVALQPDDRVLQEHPDLIRHHSDGWRDLERVPSETGWGSRCIALLGRGKTDSPYRCTIYGARPTNCRDLKAGAVACRTARQRVGLSSLPPGVARDGPWASMML